MGLLWGLVFALVARPGLADDASGNNEPVLVEARGLIQAGSAAQALRKLDAVIRGYVARYPDRQALRVARSPQESMHYALWGALEKQPVRILLNGWAEALYLKSLAHTERNERDAADAALAEALALSPQNARFLLAWAERLASSGSYSAALAAFEAAEQATELAPTALQAIERASAVRGSGLALYHLGRFSEASIKLRAAKAAAQDTHVAHALEAIDAELANEASGRLF